MKLKVESVLDKNFEPLSMKLKEMRSRNKSDLEDLIIGIERDNKNITTYKMSILKDNLDDDFNYQLVSRIVKTLLWIVGGFKIIIYGSKKIYNQIRDDYQKDGSREFDVKFMEGVYESKFEVLNAKLADAPDNTISSILIGRHLEGSRIGFDAGGSDWKVSTVVDGKSIYSEEVVWSPKLNSDPKYHFSEIYNALKGAASKISHVDAIGISTAGICINNKLMVSSLFLKVKEEDFNKYVKTIYLDAAHKLSEELGYEIPIEIANDGDVAALSGAISIGVNSLLGIAMGTSEAGGYIDKNGNITGWLNELAFVPVDYNQLAMVDEWSGDFGCGVKYFSQDAVIKLANLANIELDDKLTPAEKLKVIQSLMENEDQKAIKIYENIGCYLGYTIPYYNEFYNLEHVLLMGRVTSGKGGEIIKRVATKVLKEEFPTLAKKITIHLPEEKSRRVGQSVAAASLPSIKGD